MLVAQSSMILQYVPAGKPIDHINQIKRNVQQNVSNYLLPVTKVSVMLPPLAIAKNPLLPRENDTAPPLFQ